MNDPRYTNHGITVQRLPATSSRPKKKLSHTVKATPSARITGAFAPIATRLALVRRVKR